MAAYIFYALLFQWLILPVTPKLITHDSSFFPDYVLRVTTRNIAVACETRSSTVVNGTSPGPELRIKPGETTWIRVYNDMESQNLTMHWHGLSQRTAVFSDGSPQGSQWPIPPGHFFDYELRPELGDSGTYFYHSHVGAQALTAAGPLIVEDCGKPPYWYDEERILQWGDFFPQTDEELLSGLEAVPFVWSGETNAVLLNGKGIGIGQNLSEDGGSCQLPVIDVAPGKTYRFRFIGSTGLSLVSMAFEGHNSLTIIQVDGGEWTQPASVSRMQLGSGQRFDALFVAKTKRELEAEKRTAYFLQFETRDRPAVYRGYAVLRYSKSAPLPKYPAKAPLSLPNATYDWLEYQLQPLYPEPMGHPTLAEVTRRVTIDAVQMVDPTSNHLIWRLANLSWTGDGVQTPLLVDIYQRGEAAVPDYGAALRNHGWDAKTRAFPAKVGEVLEIVWQNTGSLVNSGGAVDVHPFHAHGQHFYDIGSGNGSYYAEANEEKLVRMGYKAVRRDTTMLYRYSTVTNPGAPAGWRAWRIRVNQPGVWLIHCHTLQHMVMGMQTAWVVGTAAEIQKHSLDQSRGYLVYGGDAYGNVTHHPTCNHQFGNSKTSKAHRLCEA
ncbi:ascorbate oxidase [Thelonectria olida]|uniref:Ascorbate oxidase n=1 Tax=Thelonectria olida TaxID=1576542 RepID=A0A9P8VSS7_9HYPO|nr:ascorbate oxidase [Thelonectria olida]